MDIGAVRPGQELTKILPDVKLILCKSIFFVARRLHWRPAFYAVDTKTGASSPRPRLRHRTTAVTVAGCHRAHVLQPPALFRLHCPSDCPVPT